jgi:hypothetical protein
LWQIIAADELTPTSSSHVAQIFGVPADAGSVEKAMAAASIRPDTEFRQEGRVYRAMALHGHLPSRQGIRFRGALLTKGIALQQKSMSTPGTAVRR